MSRKKICTGVVLACVLFMSSCGSSAKLAKNHDEMKSDSRIWDYLNVSERERALVDSIVALDEYAVFLDSFQKYLMKKNAMREGEDVEQTKEFTEYAAACSKILRITDELKLSKDASVAVFAKMREVANDK